jgi:type III secretion protein T
MIKTGMLYACPVIIVLFFAEFGLGLMNRFAPQLNVFILSMPIKSGLAMFLFVIYMEFLFDYFKVEFLRVPNALRLLEHLTYPG